MTIRLPLTLAVVRSLLARVADEMYAIPLAHVNETIELTPDVVRTVKGKEVVLTRDLRAVLVRLNPLLTGQEEIVVKQFDAVRDGPPFFGGATLLGDGRPCLIVDVSSLF